MCMGPFYFEGTGPPCLSFIVNHCLRIGVSSSPVQRFLEIFLSMVDVFVLLRRLGADLHYGPGFADFVAVVFFYFF